MRVRRASVSRRSAPTSRGCSSGTRTGPISAPDPALRRAVLLVAGLNLAYFFVEFAVALRIGSVSLFADSVDFLEDTAINLLIALALGWSVAARARIGFVLALVLLVPGVATLWTAYSKFAEPAVPAALPLSITALGALATNLACSLVLARHRRGAGSLTRAAYLSARNDAAANVGIIGAGLVTAFVWTSFWPDLIVGMLIAAMNADAAKEVWEAAREERAAEA